MELLCESAMSDRWVRSVALEGAARMMKDCVVVGGFGAWLILGLGGNTLSRVRRR